MALLEAAGGPLPRAPARAPLHRLLVLGGELAVGATRRGADARVQAQPRDHGVGVTRVGVDGDPLALAGLAPAHEAGGVERRRLEQGAAEERVGDGAGAV